MAFYPAEAQRLGEEGSVILSYTIQVDGSVDSPVVKKSSGVPILDQAAIAAALSWRYKPATRNGVAVAVPWETEVQFKLADASYPPYMPANIVNIPAADFPAGGDRRSGDTWLLVALAENGAVTGALLMRSSGSQSLDQAAIALALTRWRFTGATRDGQPMKAMLMIDARWPAAEPPPDAPR